MPKPMHMGLFSSFTPPAWNAGTDRNHGADWWSGDYYARLARRAEAACFDFLFFEDTASVSRTRGGSMDLALKLSLSSPKNDPVALISYLAGQTSQLGLVATASTTLYPPFLLARLYSTIDNLSKGRAGWNIVTSSEEESAHNFGLDALPPTAERYDMAEEFVAVARALWDSWDEGAVIADQDNNIYVDPAKVHEINHKGRYFKVRGPLNSFPSPQKRPVFAQAGGSPRGRDFAAKNAEMVMSTTIGGIEAMKSFREDMHGRMKSFGRDPSECRILYALHVYTSDSVESFRATITDSQLIPVLGKHSAHLGIDLLSFDLNAPFPGDVQANGTTSMLEALKEKGRRGQTLREAIIDFNWSDEIGAVGTPAAIAENLIGAMAEVGGDGYIIMASQDANQAHLDGIFDGVIPELKARGAMRDSYAGPTLRENLFSF